jgi:hypothetical protein
MWRLLLLIVCLLCLGGCAYLLNRPPYAYFVYWPDEGYAPLAVAFDASSSSDPDGQSLTYRWEFGDGYTAHGVTVTHTYSSAGTYTARLYVGDTMGETSSAWAQVEVLERQLYYYNFPATSNGFWDFVSYCQEHWTYEADTYGEPCQYPFTSNVRMRGDCDDFAVMIAYYTQEYFGYDSKIYKLDFISDAAGHAVAGVRTSMDVIYWYYAPCPYSPGPYVTSVDTTYLLIDMTRCVSYGKDDVILICDWEWYEVAGRILSLSGEGGIRSHTISTLR